MRVLILGGTGEGSALADALAGDGRFDVTLSLAGVTSAPRRSAVAMRSGGFGGSAGLADWLRRNGTAALVDATHPFAAAMSANAAVACEAAGIERMRINRPPWQPGPGDRWEPVADMAHAAAALGGAPLRVLLGVGRKELAPFADHPQHHYLVRSVDRPPDGLLPPRHEVLTLRGPFRLENERALLDSRRIQVLVTKNSGGAAASAKLEAARERELRVVMVERPPVQPGPSVPDWPGALGWLVRRHAAATERAV